MGHWEGAVRIIRKWDSGLGKIFLFPLTLFSYGFLVVVVLRVFLYRVGIFKTEKLGCRVVSIGNLTAGGTGKTPLILNIAQLLRDSGERVVVISRGYKGRKRKEVTVVSQGEGPLVPWEEAGEEPYWLACRSKGVPVLVGINRYRVGCYALKKFQATVILLDDGFQHLKLHRDLDVLLLDCTAPFGNGYLLPRGLLREPISHMKRANVVVLTRVNQTQNAEETFQKIKPWVEDKPIFRLNFFPTGISFIGGKSEQDIDFIRGKRVLAVSGIGNPSNFRKMLLGLDAKEVVEKVYPDHHHYSQGDIDEILEEGRLLDLIITTGKDSVKISPFLEKGSAVGVLEIEGRFPEKKEWMAYIVPNRVGSSGG